VTRPDVEGLLRELAPQALGAVARRYGEFADAEDAVQEALASAATQWPDAMPDKPLSWLITVASRRLVDEYRRTDARRRREQLAGSLSIHPDETLPSSDDSLVMLFLCCDDTLSSTLAIPLTLRAVAGLTTREIAAAYLVPEATMAQRISRAKAKLRGRRFELPACARSSTCCSTRATPPRAGRTCCGSTCRARRSGWPGCCTGRPGTPPRSRDCSR
jgi:RNA polymerase sigma factor (sigma-70 family)